MRTIRPCGDDDRAAIVAIVNAAAEAYRGVIPADRWRDPYMPLHELDGEIAAGVVFWGYEADGELIRGWSAPDYSSVNLSEAGCERVMEAVLGAGVGIEAGVGSVEDAERLAASGLGHRVVRILVEPEDPGAERTVAVVDEIHAALDRLGLETPKLQHSDGAATWTLIDDAIRRGVDTRVGLEDTLHGRDGEPAAGNASLVWDGAHGQ